MVTILLSVLESLRRVAVRRPPADHSSAGPRGESSPSQPRQKVNEQREQR
jgi:hypothetical protein